MFKLGKKPRRLDSRTLQIKSYLTSDLPAPPASVNWAGPLTSWGMMGNDTIGDCTIATCGHLVMEWTQNATGSPVVIPDADILAAYQAVSGYVPGNESTDSGADPLSVLQYWRSTGVGGHQIAAFAQVTMPALTPSHRFRHGEPTPPLDETVVKQAIDLFGGIYIGLELPSAWQGAPLWDVGPGSAFAPGSWGGHAVPAIAYDENGVTVVTWGQLMPMTWAAFARYCDESFACLSQDWITAATQQAPVGFDLAQLQSDLADLG